MKVLTIAVPAYNVESYLEKCLDSFLNSEILDQLEVLVINDGSTDQTARIAEGYVERYPQTFHLIQKENGGHGSAINTGIREATGKYFRVVDGDDWLDTEKLSKFVQLLEMHEEDVIATDFETVRDGDLKPMARWACTQDETLYGTSRRLTSGQVKDVVMMHSFTIRTAVLKKVLADGFAMDEHRFYVDMEYITYPVPYLDTIYFEKMNLYRYRLGRNGQSVDIRSLQKKRDQHRTVLDQLLRYYGKCRQENLDAGRLHYIARSASLMIQRQFRIYISMGSQPGIREELKEWDQGIKEQYPEVYSATRKKSIDLLRKTDYRILPFAAIAYRIVMRDKT